MGAISIGTTGLTASSKQMDVIGNNLANSNTLGYKASSTQFASILSDSGTLAVGQGVSVAGITTQFSQGSFENTGNATDLAIDGEGFFMVKDNEGAVYCTRAGAFHINAAGYLVDTNDYQVQGYTASATDVDAVEEETAISLQNVQSAPKASTEISIGANLDEDAGYGDKFNVSQSVFDTKGKMHNLSIIFQKTEGQGMWGFEAKLDSTNISDTGVNQPACGITFDSNGLLSGLYKGDVTTTSPTSWGHGDVDNVVDTTAGDGTVSETVVNNPGELTATLAGIKLTRNADAVPQTWTLSGNGAGDYANAALTVTESSAGTLSVDLDTTAGAGTGADIIFTLAGTWAEDDFFTFDVTKTNNTAGATIESTLVSRPGQLYKDTTGDIVLTKESATVWSVTAGGGYTDILAWQEASDGRDYLKVDLDRKGGVDIVFDLGASAGNDWAANDVVTFDIVKTAADLMDVVFAFGDLGNGAEIGVSDDTTNNQITWDITGDTANIVTGYSSTSVIKSIRDDGYTSGVLKGLNIGRDGVISGFFTNGQTSNLSQIVLADFPNADGLMKIGSYFVETNKSGGALKNRPGSASLGEIRSNSLEISNTDVAKEFINMITAQRAYQASSRIITTADQMLTELMNIKR
jgi:flagellar hook protein FlgE